MPYGDASKVKVGPGFLRIAPLGTTEPTDLTTAWNASWIEMGYTAEGHAFTSTPSFEGIEVAEELQPIRYEGTGLEYQIEFALAEITAKNFQTALNGGTITTGTGIVTFEPPAADTLATRVMIGWESKAKDERWVWRKCLQTGATEVARRKAPDKATIPMTWMLEVVSGSAPFKAIFANPA